MVAKQSTDSRLDPTPDLLTGWKAIADYLHCNIKTAQRMEKRGELPVIRPQGGPKRKESIFASKRAIELWLKGYIESVALTDDQLLAFGRGSKPLWSYSFPHRLRVYDRDELAWRLQVVDLRGIGEKGVIAAVQLQGDEEEELRCFDAQGELVWSVRVDPILRKGDGRPFERAWTIKHVIVVAEASHQSVWVALANYAGWGGCILRVDAEGVVTLRFANAGHIERIAATTVHDEQCLVFCGENNDYDCAFVALLGLDDPMAYSVPGKRSVYRFADASDEWPRKLVLFPRSELIRARQKPYGHTTALRLYEDRIIVHVETGGDGADFLYHFTSGLEPMYVFPSGSHEFVHRELARKHFIDHDWPDCPELKKPMALRIWTANTGWTTRPIPWRDDPWKDD